MTADQLAAATGATTFHAGNWLAPITAAMEAYAINTRERAAAFLAQIGHESGRLVYVREIWGPTTAQLGYEGRKDLGNLRPGDGRRYLGRGLIQLTGRANAIAVREGMKIYLPAVPDFEQSPELFEQPQWAAMSAAWFWATHGCNELADAGSFMSITRRINGGTNGYQDRLALWESAKQALGA